MRCPNASTIPPGDGELDEHLVVGNVDAVHRAGGVLDRLEAVWRSRIDQIGEILAEEPREGASR